MVIIVVVVNNIYCTRSAWTGFYESWRWSSCDRPNKNFFEIMGIINNSNADKLILFQIFDPKTEITEETNLESLLSLRKVRNHHQPDIIFFLINSYTCF